MKYYKILNEEECHNEFQYQTGLNVDTNEFDPSPECGGGMFYASRDILAFLDYGCWLREVTIPDGVDIVKVNDWGSQKFKSPEIVLGERELIDIEVIERLIAEGVDVTAGDNFAVRWASAYGHTDVVKLLIVHGADVTARDNSAVLWASNNGHIDVVKLLIEHGADVTAYGNHSILNASENGHTDVVKLLIERGADVTARDNQAIRRASENGHTDVVKLLIERGATLNEELE